MAKKSKKITPHQQQKILNAQLRKVFVERLKKICETIGDKSYFNLLTPHFIDYLYAHRGYNIGVFPKADTVVPKELLKTIFAILRHWSHTTQIEIIEGSGKTLSCDDFLHIIQPMSTMIKFKTVEFKGMEVFEPLIENGDRLFLFYYETILKIIEAFLMFEIDLLSHHTYRIRLEADEYSLRGKFSIELERVEMDTVHVTINGNSRLCVRCGFILNSKVVYPDIPVSTFDPQSKFGKLNVPVYIQLHAVNRIVERTDLPTSGLVNFYLFESLIIPHISFNEDGRMLIEFRIEDIKAGYLLADLTDGMIIIRTFLLLTNNGTPEGKKLEELTGLQKDDKKYWGIDNLKALAHSDILENEEICNIFRQAGCESLLQLCEKMQKKDFAWKLTYDIEGENTDISYVSSALLGYLQKGTSSIQSKPEECVESSLEEL